MVFWPWLDDVLLFAPVGEQLLLVGNDSRIRDAQAEELELPGFAVVALTRSGDGDFVAALGKYGDVVVWSAKGEIVACHVSQDDSIHWDSPLGIELLELGNTLLVAT